MLLDIAGRPTSDRHIRVGFIGCGSHAFRNIYPTFQFAPVELIATCDLDPARAAAFAKQFGAERSYTDHHQMLANEKLDAVFIVTNYDEQGRPRYPGLAKDCLRAGLDVWMEKPPAASSADLAELKQIAGDNRVMVGLKKMFFPANEKLRELIHADDFGTPMLAQLTYPERIPTLEEFRKYVDDRQPVQPVVYFLDHLCHPASLLLLLFGMPKTLYYERATSGAGIATFGYADGKVASLLFTHGSAALKQMERTTVVSDRGRHAIVENNIRVTYHRDAKGLPYGTSPDYFAGSTDNASLVWEPEFTLGQIYNKGLFLLGYYGEVNEFASAIIAGRPLKKAGLEHAWQVTKIFEGFAQGPRTLIEL